MNNTRVPTRVPRFFGPLLDFLFPVEESVRTLENVSANELERLLPPSEPINEDAVAVFAYNDERVKRLVWEIKYYRNAKIAETVGALIAEKIKEKIGQSGGQIFQSTRIFSDRQFFLVSVPLTSRRLRERGFNHTELIAKSVLKNLPENFALAPDILKKIRHTPKQSSIENRERRFQNIVGAFEVSEPRLVAGKNIIVIDDVITTGATVTEAKRALFEAGAKSVRAFAVAH